MRENLKKLWKQFRQEHEEKFQQIEKERKKLLKNWEEKSNKIKSGELTLNDYTSIVEKNRDYLCYFLETETYDIFGSSKPGDATNFMVKLNKDGTTYTLKKNLKSRRQKETKDTYETAKAYFENDIRPFLKKILDQKNTNEIISFLSNEENKKKYSAKQILRKMIALENEGEFLYIYSNAFLDQLYEYFLPEKEKPKSELQKSADINTYVMELLDLQNAAKTDLVIMSWFLIRLIEIQSIADDHSLNVILYGPPGTGKTYSVMQMIKLLCIGDNEQYEYIQFHPSYTYEDFIEGIKPKGVGEDGNIQFELVNGIFKKFCIKAKINPDKKYYFVVDEINRANLSAVFGETLSRLEKDYRHNLEKDR